MKESRRYHYESTSSEARDVSGAYLPSTMAYRDITAIAYDDDWRFFKAIERGVGVDVFQDFMRFSGLHIEEAAKLFQVTSRTLRRLESGDVLNDHLGERLVELIRLYERGFQVFGSLRSFDLYVRSEIAALGGRRPMDFMSTSMGIHILMDELTRIECGIFA